MKTVKGAVGYSVFVVCPSCNNRFDCIDGDNVDVICDVICGDISAKDTNEVITCKKCKCEFYLDMSDY